MKEYYQKVAISNSGMASINPEQGGTPARYKKYIIDGEKTDEETPSLENGKLVHLYVEDPGAFVVSDVDRPTDMLASWVEETYYLLEIANIAVEDVTKDNELIKTTALGGRGERYKSIKDEDKVWAKFCEGLPYLKHLILQTSELCITSKQKELVEACVASLRGKKVANELLFQTGEDFGDQAFNELLIYWKEEVLVDGQHKVELECKALLDRLKIFVEKKKVHIVDLKTTSKPISRFSNSFEYYRYYRQMSWYLRAAMQYIEREHGSAEGWEFSVAMVVVETTGLHETVVFNVTPKWIQVGIEECQELLGRIAFATQSNNWVESIEEIRGNGVVNLIHEDDAGTKV